MTIGERIEALNKHLVGTEANYEGSKGKRTKKVSGVVKEVRFAGCSISNDRGEWMGIELLIKPKVGRAVWTWAMPDEVKIPEGEKDG